MRRPLLDADVFRCLRDLRLLDPVAEALRPPGLAITEYVARHELALVASDVGRLERAGLLEVIPLYKGTPEATRYRELQRRADKGEAESVAWALGFERGRRPVFVTRDGGATRLARAERVPTTDLFGLVVHAIDRGLQESVARDQLSVWDTPGSTLCRPRDYPSFDRALSDRRRQEASLFQVPSTER